MGVRETINEHSKIAGITTIVIILAIVVYIMMMSKPDDANAPLPQSHAYFTTDDSSRAAAKSALFVDTIDKLAPFQKDGKTAYRAYVFTCDGGKTTWVGYLERYTPEGLRQMQARGSAKNLSDAELLRHAPKTPGIQIKKPGSSNWIDQSDMASYSAVIDVRCPDGSKEHIDLVNP